MAGKTKKKKKPTSIGSAPTRGTGLLSKAAKAKAKRKEALERAAGKRKAKPKAKAKSKIEQGKKTGKSPKGIKKTKEKGKRELIALRKKQAERAKKLKRKNDA